MPPATGKLAGTAVAVSVQPEAGPWSNLKLKVGGEPVSLGSFTVTKPGRSAPVLLGETLMMMSTKPGFVLRGTAPTMVTNAEFVEISGVRLHSETALRVIVAMTIWPPAGFIAPRGMGGPDGGGTGIGWKGGKLGRTSP